MSKERLNPRQMLFVDGIEKGMSQVEAYLAAGYDGGKDNHSAYSYSSQLFTNPKIVAELYKRVSNRKAGVRQRLSTMSDMATNLYIKIMSIKSDDPEIMRLQQKTASDILDRNGHKPKEEIEHTGDISISVSKAILDGSYYDKIKSS
jgi:hypothetical protein